MSPPWHAQAKIRGASDTDYVGASAADRVTATPEDNPSNLAVIAVTSTSVLLSWTAPVVGVRPDGYRIVYRVRANATVQELPLPLEAAAALALYMDKQQVPAAPAIHDFKSVLDHIDYPHAHIHSCK